MQTLGDGGGGQCMMCIAIECILSIIQYYLRGSINFWGVELLKIVLCHGRYVWGFIELQLVWFYLEIREKSHILQLFGGAFSVILLLDYQLKIYKRPPKFLCIVLYKLYKNLGGWLPPTPGSTTYVWCHLPWYYNTILNYNMHGLQ